MSTTAATFPIAEALFSKTRRAVLALLFGQPDKSFYTREIVAAAGAGASQVQKELDQLTRAGLLIRERRANQVHFRVNAEAPVFAELVGLVAKTFGIADVVRARLAPLRDRIDTAFIYGSVARGEHHASSDIDVFLVGEILLSQLALPLSEAEKSLGRQVSTTIFDRKEFVSRLKKRDHFVSKILTGPKIFLIGDDARLKEVRAGA
jgi:predicted nucleotidyltransferase